MLTTFRTYQLSVSFYRAARSLNFPTHLRDQFERAASSVVLNLAEGQPQRSAKQQARYYTIALGSFREAQACVHLASNATAEIDELANKLGAHLHRLLQSCS